MTTYSIHLYRNLAFLLIATSAFAKGPADQSVATIIDTTGTISTKKEPKNQKQKYPATSQIDVSSATISAPAQTITQTTVPTQAPAKTADASLKKKKRSRSNKVAQIKEKKPKKKTISTMNYLELKEGKERLMAAGDKEIALKYMQKMVPLCTDLSELCTLMVELADTLLETGSPDEAGTTYLEFTKLYPGHEKVEYATYKAIECRFNRILSADRDQTITREALELTEQFLARSDVFTTHIHDVERIRDACRTRLLESEISIASYYLKKGSFDEAEYRLTSMRSTFVPVLPSSEPDILHLECLLAEKQNNTEQLLKKQAELSERFPATNATHLITAQMAKKSKKRSSDRF